MEKNMLTKKDAKMAQGLAIIGMDGITFIL